MGQDVYEDMLYDEYAKKMAATAQFGLADMIYQVSSVRFHRNNRYRLYQKGYHFGQSRYPVRDHSINLLL